MANWKDHLIYWKKKLDLGLGEEETLNIVRKLYKVPITVELLQETGIGKVVKYLGKQEGKVGEKATVVLNKWKELVLSSSQGSSEKHLQKHVSSSKKLQIKKEEKTDNHRESHKASKHSNYNHNFDRTSTAREDLSHQKNIVSKVKVKSFEHRNKLARYDSDVDEHDGLNQQSYTVHNDSDEYSPSENTTHNLGEYNDEEINTEYSYHSSDVEMSDHSSKYLCYSNDIEHPPGAYNPDYPSYDSKKHMNEEYHPKDPPFVGSEYQCNKVKNTHNVKTQAKNANSSHVTQRQSPQSEKVDYVSNKHKKSEKYLKSTECGPSIYKSNYTSSPQSSNSPSPVSNYSKEVKKASKDKVKQKIPSSKDVLKLDKPPKDKSSEPSKVKHQKEKIQNDKKSGSSKSSKKKLIEIADNEGFTSSVTSFEACLGLNDAVTVRKKKSSSKTSNGSSSKTSSGSSSKTSSGSSSKTSSGSSSKTSNGINSSSKGQKSQSSKSKSSKIAEPVKVEKSSSKKKHSKPTITFVEAVEKIKPTPLEEVDILSTLPEIQPNYKPLRHKDADSPPRKKKVMTNEEAIMFTSSRKDRTAVYSGRKAHYLTEVPTLYDSCIRVLIDNIDAIGYTGGVPYDVLKPVLERCDPQQLFSLENDNPYLLDDTDHLWRAHCIRNFRTHHPDEGESWRDLFLRVFDEREARLKSVTANISASMSKANTGRTTKLAYVDSVAKPPRDIARRQAKHGTGLPFSQPQKAGPPSKASPRPMAPAINSAATSSQSNSSSSVIPKKPKVAPLMQKTLKFMKQHFRR